MITISIFLLGLFIGSFLGVLTDRIPFNKQFLTGRSKCDSCKAELRWYDLIPVLSFVFSNGKCRHCSVKLSLFYPIIEVSTGILFVLTYIFVIFNFSSQGGSAFGGQFTIYSEFSVFSFQLIFNLFIVSSLTVIFFTDLKYGIIPNKIIFPAILITFAYLIINHPTPLSYGDYRQSLVINHLFTAVFSFLFLLLVSAIFYFLTKKQSMGGGDIKFTFLMGLILGFPDIILAFYLAFLTGAAYSIILILWKKKSFRKDSIPFGPFLALATIISIFWGNFLLENTLKLLGI